MTVSPWLEFDAQSPEYVSIRWIMYAGLLGVIGAVIFRIVVERARRLAPSDLDTTAFVTRALGRARPWAIGFATLLLLSSILRLLAQSLSVYGEGWLDAELVSALLRDTEWGRAWMAQLAATLVALGIAVVRPRENGVGGRGPLSPVVGLLATVTLAVSTAASGHPAAAHPLALAMATDTIHVLAAGGWIGTLVFVLLVGLPAASAAAPDSRPRLARELILRFSGIALPCAATIALTGVVSAWIQIRSLPALWTTSYGLLLLIKLAFVVVVAAAGGYNWRVATPRLPESGGIGRMRRVIGTETAFAACVLLVTASLVATPPPADAMTAGEGHEAMTASEQDIAWTTELVERRLRDAGIEVARLPDTGTHIFMSVPPTSYAFADGDELQVFVYPDTASRARDIAKLDTRRVAPPDMMIKRRAQASLLVGGNLAVIVMTNDATRREHIGHALAPLVPPR